MFDESFVVALAAQIAARIIPEIEQHNGKPKAPARLLTVKEAAAYIGRSEQAIQHLIHKRELISWSARAGACTLTAVTWTVG